MFAKYLSAGGYFVKTIMQLTEKIKTMLSAFAFTRRQPMKLIFTWGTRAIHLRSISVFHCPNRNELFQIIETTQQTSLFSEDGATA